MKAAIASETEVADRVRRLRTLGLPLVLELHTFGHSDLVEPFARATCVRRAHRLREHASGARLLVHVPPQDPATLAVQDFDSDQVRVTIEFAHAIGASGVVVHRYLRLRRAAATMAGSREAEGERFLDLLQPAIIDSGPLTVHVENLGFYWMRPKRTRAFLVSPLDHFFPWEQETFVASTERRALRHVVPMVDVAHAAISSNMFNLRRRDADRFLRDPRFSGIYTSDLERASQLSPADFIHPRARHVHCSDAFLAVTEPGWATGTPDAFTVWRWLTAEGLPVGCGNLDFNELVRALMRHDERGAVTLVAEIASGRAQERALVEFIARVVEMGSGSAAASRPPGRRL